MHRTKCHGIKRHWTKCRGQNTTGYTGQNATEQNVTGQNAIGQNAPDKMSPDKISRKKIIIIIIIIKLKRVLLKCRQVEKNFKNTVHQSTLQKKLRSADSVQGELGKGNSERLSVCDAVTLDGKLFQTRGAATKKARSPIVERRDDSAGQNATG